MLASVAGVSLVIVVMLDMFWTTLTTRGSGLLTSMVSRGLQRLLTGLRQLSHSRRPLAMAGPATLVVLGVFWIGALWLGWLLIFSSLLEAVVNSQTRAPASLSELIYYVGFTLSTLGVGDFQPQGTLPQILTSVAAFNGLVLVTLIITYALPVVSAAIARRQLAFSISMLGDTPIAILKNTRRGTGFHSLESTLERLEPALLQSTEQRLAYPIVDCFFSQEAALSLNLQLAILDEALTLATLGLEAGCQPDRFAVERTRKGIGYYLTSSPPTASQPKVPKLSSVPLQDWARSTSAIAVRSPAEFESLLSELAERRRALHRLVQRDGWRWDEVHATSDH